MRRKSGADVWRGHRVGAPTTVEAPRAGRDARWTIGRGQCVKKVTGRVSRAVLRDDSAGWALAA
ncbi:MAG: hypothetical protein U0P48_14635, partial [Ancrocorticia sp.]